MKTDMGEWKQYHEDFDYIIMEKATHFLVWQYPDKFNENLLKIIKTL